MGSVVELKGLDSEQFSIAGMKQQVSPRAITLVETTVLGSLGGAEAPLWGNLPAVSGTWVIANPTVLQHPHILIDWKIRKLIYLLAGRGPMNLQFIHLRFCADPQHLARVV